MPSILMRPAVRSAETNRVRFEVSQLLSLVLGSAFLGTGIAKIVATDFVIQTFQQTALAPALLVVIGITELIAAVLTIVPTTRLLGTGLISTVMIGAVGYHMVRAEFLLMGVPLLALSVAVTALVIEFRMRRDEVDAAPATVLARR